MPHLALLTLTCMLSIVLAPSAESVLSHYRGVTLGDPVQAVVDHLGLAASDVKVVHERPTVVQELTWKPHRFVSGTVVEPDSLGEMVLTFHAGRLARITVAYDPDRTKGLTDADLHEALGHAYGVSLLAATPTTAAPGVRTGRQTIGHWEDAETLLLLWREPYPARVGLTITSVAADHALRDAIDAGLRLDADAAPALELARRAGAAAAILEREEKIRLANKATFKP